MTVCIAAICDGGQKVVVGADRMFTFQAPQNLEFQTPEKKIEGIVFPALCSPLAILHTRQKLRERLSSCSMATLIHLSCVPLMY